MDIFRQIALSQAPRILGQGDRDSTSATFGCFDRYYWHYKLHDLANARFQEAAHLLALLYANDFPGNIYFGKPRVREWAEAAIRFWLSIRHRDGSVDEVYPNERSFCATAFSTWAVTEAILALDLKCPDGLERTGAWLVRNDNLEVANQEAAAVIALHNVAKLTGKAAFQRAAEDRVERLLDAQADDGHFPEYGGYDVGYTTVLLSCLAKHAQQQENGTLLSALQRSARLVEQKVQANGAYDIEGTSRRTQFLYPYGLAVVKSDALGRLQRGLGRAEVIHPGWMDDRYCVALTIDYLRAYLEARP